MKNDGVHVPGHASLMILSAGTNTTVQDLGRQGFLGIGVTEGGAIDGFAHRLGQRLLGNPISSASLETAWGGLVIAVNAPVYVAVTGATLPLTIDGETAPCHQPLPLEPGQVLQMGRPEQEIFSYLSITGGICTPPVLGSRSTVVREGLGGLEGRILRAGDRLPIGAAASAPAFLSVPKALHRHPDALGDTLTLRFLPGFQYQDVSEIARRTLESQRYLVTGARDRMGARLSGMAVQTEITALFSEAVCSGAIQIPPDGQPIVLLNDRQTMGGYPKLGAVLSVDCVRLSQAPVGTPLRFQALSPADADRVLWLEQNYEQELARALAGNVP